MDSIVLKRFMEVKTHSLAYFNIWYFVRKIWLINTWRNADDLSVREYITEKFS